MEMHNSFTVAADVATAWEVLLDVPRIAPCMPGAELTEIVDDNHFKGNAKVRVGPVQLSFAGDAELVEVDPKAHTARVIAGGNDSKGRGAAQADVKFALIDDSG
ncbi:MAG: SRPBCC domain-containing protein, partial [Alphaproteobacteria bacterium]|nr:SRPBCC domain-containing protein [Alphaproteobacteria bacterium]